VQGGSTCAFRESKQLVIEAPWLVNDGHGASLRHHKWHLQNLAVLVDPVDEVEGDPRRQPPLSSTRYFMIRTEAVAEIPLRFC
jgi:hypothetical protein